MRRNIEGIGGQSKSLSMLSNIQIIATGSSSFELANKTAESMAGTYTLCSPVLVGEIEQGRDTEKVNQNLKSLRFGLYPN